MQAILSLLGDCWYYKTMYDSEIGVEMVPMVHHDNEMIVDQDIEDLSKYPDDADFSFITSIYHRKMIESAYKTITLLEKWDFLREYEIDR